MLYTIVKKCSSYEEQDEGEGQDINLKEIMDGDAAKNSEEAQKMKRRMLIKGKI